MPESRILLTPCARMGLEYRIPGAAIKFFQGWFCDGDPMLLRGWQVFWRQKLVTWNGRCGPQVGRDVAFRDPDSFCRLISCDCCLSFLKILAISLFVGAKSAHTKGRHFGASCYQACCQQDQCQSHSRRSLSLNTTPITILFRIPPLPSQSFNIYIYACSETLVYGCGVCVFLL